MPAPELLQRSLQALVAQLRFVDSAYAEIYEQFQHLSEEYDNRVEECQFFELQCHRLDHHSRSLELKISGPAIGLAAVGRWIPMCKLAEPGTPQSWNRSELILSTVVILPLRATFRYC